MDEPLREDLGIRQFVIVTGMSGAGKTMTLKVLEDCGFLTLDGLPLELLPQIFQIFANHRSAIKRGIVATMDVRNVETPEVFLRTLEEVRASVKNVRVLFLTASDEELLRRYEKTRRVHPLGRGLSTLGGVQREREVLAPLLAMADAVIDTSMMDLSQHRERLMKEFFKEGADGEGTLRPEGVSLLVSSFGFKYGVPQDSSFVLDVRSLPNPFYVEELRPLSGVDRAVQDYLLSFPETVEFMDRCQGFLDVAVPQYLNAVRGQLHIAVGCTGGRHRSVAVAEWLYQAYAPRYEDVCVLHRDREKA